MITIVAGTNRKNSLSLALAKYMQKEFLQHGQSSNLVALEDLPEDFTTSALYDNNGKDASFNLLRQKVGEADKLVFVIPEYNGSFPGVLKAFIDGLGYPSEVKGKKAALIGLSSGTQGSALAMSHFADVLGYLGAHVLAMKPRISEVEKNFSKDEGFADPKIAASISEQVETFISF